MSDMCVCHECLRSRGSSGALTRGFSGVTASRLVRYGGNTVMFSGLLALVNFRLRLFSEYETFNRVFKLNPLASVSRTLKSASVSSHTVKAQSDFSV